MLQGASVPNANEFLSLLRAYLWLALPAGLLLGGIWLLIAQPPRRLFGPQRLRAVPWRGADILLIIFLTQFFIPAAVQSALPRDYPVNPWNPVLSFPFQVAAILFVLMAGSGTRLFQLGLTAHRLATNLFLGYLAWALLTPLVYALDYLVTELHAAVLPLPSEKHPLIESLQKTPGFLGYFLLFLAAVVAAPVYEELLFRGILQPWFARRRWGADAALVAAFGLAVYAGLASKVDKDFFLAGNPNGLRVLVEGLGSAVFVLVMIPGYIYADRLLWHWLPQPGAGRTIYAVALLFAAAHANVWPSPIPLFLLGLGLGYLAYRTQSLVSCMTAHALFNGTTVLVQLWS
jgi:membrane protease YdiL (CAAX protease family)